MARFVSTTGWSPPSGLRIATDTSGYQGEPNGPVLSWSPAQGLPGAKLYRNGSGFVLETEGDHIQLWSKSSDLGPGNLFAGKQIEIGPPWGATRVPFDNLGEDLQLHFHMFKEDGTPNNMSGIGCTYLGNDKGTLDILAGGGGKLWRFVRDERSVPFQSIHRLIFLPEENVEAARGYAGLALHEVDLAFELYSTYGEVRIYAGNGNDIVFQTNGQLKMNDDPVLRKVGVPVSAGSAGSPGDFAVDVNYSYFCIATNTWVRAAVATW
jgi:hypothetical protein